MWTSCKEAVRTVDGARAGGETADWEWALQHAVFPGTQPGTPIIRGLDLVDHASHDVDALRLVVCEETPSPEAFRAGAERMTGWLADPHDANYWRAKAGLPPRQTC
jgi:hypothetical protein